MTAINPNKCTFKSLTLCLQESSWKLVLFLSYGVMLLTDGVHVTCPNLLFLVVLVWCSIGVISDDNIGYNDVWTLLSAIKFLCQPCIMESDGLMDKVSASQPRDLGFEPHTGHDHVSSYDTSNG